MLSTKRILKYALFLGLLFGIYVCLKSVAREDLSSVNEKLPNIHKSGRHVSRSAVTTLHTNSGFIKQNSTDLYKQDSIVFTEECQHIRSPNFGLITSDSWVTAFQNPNTVHIFSAFLEKDENNIKITGIADASNRAGYCQIWYKENDKVNVHFVKVTFSVIPETHGLRFVPVLISCPVPLEIKSLVSAVSVVSDKCDEANHILNVHSRPDNWKPTDNFTLCPAPFNREYDKLGEFLQYVEVNNLFGADHFVFYNHSVSAKLQPYIDYYLAQGTIEVLQWRIPVETKQGKTNEIHYFGQVIAQAECFLRAMMNSKYVACVDMDEVIVPMISEDWQSIIGDDPSMGTFVFPNVFFRKEWAKDPTFEQESLMQKYPIDALLYTNREPKVWPHNSRSKYIARPEAVVLPGIHYPFQMRAGYRSKPIPSTQGLLAHYRDWEDYREAEKKEERRMHVFSDKILERISRVDNIVNGE